MALGKPRRSVSASSVRSQAQLIFDPGPRPRLTFLDLFHSVANFLGLGGVSTSSGSTTRLGLMSTPLLCFANATKSPSRMFRASKISRGITTWRRCPTRPIGSRVEADVLVAMLSDYLTVRDSQACAAG